MITPFELHQLLEKHFKEDEYKPILKSYIKYHKRRMEREKMKIKKETKEFKKYVKKIKVEFNQN
jgi:hypothetical protein